MDVRLAESPDLRAERAGNLHGRSKEEVTVRYVHWKDEDGDVLEITRRIDNIVHLGRALPSPCDIPGAGCMWAMPQSGPVPGSREGED